MLELDQRLKYWYPQMEFSNNILALKFRININWLQTVDQLRDELGFIQTPDSKVFKL